MPLDSHVWLNVHWGPPVAQLYDYTPKQILNLTPTPKIAHVGPEEPKDPRIRSTVKARIVGKIDNKSSSPL